MEDHARRLDDAARRVRGRQALLESITRQIDEQSQPVTVGERRVRSMRALRLRRVIPDYNQEGALWRDSGALSSGSCAQLRVDPWAGFRRRLGE
ncbi:MAG: hypothetical protein LBK95_14165 [Bifidobacteriaceae bacterium]|nr:hypothetical protein [Bifidobacteriaceae bacterium]